MVTRARVGTEQAEVVKTGGETPPRWREEGGGKYETAFLKMRFGAHLLRCERRKVVEKVEDWKETTTMERHETRRECGMGGEGKGTGVVKGGKRERRREKW